MAEKTEGQRSRELAKGLFGSKFKEAKARVDSNWEKEGHYYSRIDRVKLAMNRKDQTGFFVEKTIVHVLDDADGEGHRVGESVSHSMWKHHESFFGNVKAFMACALGLSPDDIEEEHILSVVDDEQILAGTVLESKNRVTQTKKGTNFTVINYQREVPATDLLKILPEAVQKNFFPDNILQLTAEHEAAAVAS